MKILNEMTVMHFAFPKAPEKEGYLLKRRSGGKKAFKRRYFVLRGNILLYSETKLDREPLGVIFLEGHSVELVDERMFAIHFHSVAYTGRSYILQAASDAEAESWMQALAHCGSEFLILSVEELEDALRGLNSLSDPANGNKSEIAGQHSAADPAPVGPRNPFSPPLTRSISCDQEEKRQQRSISHLTGLLMLSWEKMHADARNYLDDVAGLSDVSDQQQ